MSSVRELEEELKRLLLTASKPRPTEPSTEKPGGKDHQEASSGKKIRKRRGKRRAKESVEEVEGGGVIAGAAAASPSAAAAAGATRKPSKEKNRVAYPNGHPWRGQKVPCVTGCPLCRYPGKQKDDVYSLWSMEDKKLWRTMMWGRQKKEKKQEKKRERVEKAKMKKAAKERIKIDQERMKVVEDDLKASGVGGVAVPNYGLKPDLVEAIRAEQKKLKLLKKVDLSKPAGQSKVEGKKDADSSKKVVDPKKDADVSASSPAADVVRAKESPPRKPMSETMSQKDLVDIFGSIAETPTDQVFADLEKEGIFLLKKKNARFPKAKFFCRTCDYHLDSAQLCFRHIYEERHIRVKLTKEQDMLIRFVPTPSTTHVEVVTKTLEQVVERIRLKDEDIQRRKLAVEKVEKLANTEGGIPSDVVSLEFYGSSMTGFGTVSSDVNIDVRVSKRKPRSITTLTTKSATTDEDESTAATQTPSSSDAHDPASSTDEGVKAAASPRAAWSTASVMMKIAEVLKEDSRYLDVKTDFQSKVPCIYATDASDIGAPLRLVISTGNRLSCETSKLLHAYSKIDERATKLAILFRYLGQIIEIDDPTRGTMPAYCLTLMAIYYCQKCPVPILPVLQALYPLKSKVQPERMVDGRNCYFFDDLDNLSQLWSSHNPFSLGALWLSMLRYYSCEFEANQIVVSIRQVKLLTREEKKWTAKRVAMEDPFNHKRNLANCVPASATFDYISERLRNAYLYFTVPQLKEGGAAFTSITPRVSQCQCVCRSLLRQFARRCSEAKDEAAKRKSKEATVKTATEKKEEPSVGAFGPAPVAEVADETVAVGKMVKSVESGVKRGETVRANSDCVDGKDGRESASQPDGFDQLVGMLTTLVMSDALEEAKEMLRKTHYKNAQKLEVLVKYGEETANHVLKDVMEFLREEVKTEERAALTEGKDARCGLDGKSSGTTSGDGIVLIDEKLAPDVIVEESSDSSPSTSSSSEDDVSDEDDDESSDLDGGAQEAASETLTALFDGDLVMDDRVGTYESDKTEVKSASMPLDTEQSFEPVCERCRQLRALLLEVEDDIEATALEFNFTKDELGDPKGPPAICSYCLKDGHFKDACPEEALPELSPLPPLTPSHLSNLDSVLSAIPHDYAPLERETRLRLSILQELQSYVREIFPDSSLQLFGSSVNGFGFRNSDMDICMTLGGNYDEEGLTDAEVRKVIERLAQKFRSHRDLTSVFPITTAKVPIVKFTYVHQNGHGRGAGTTRVDGDISLYNTLALHNTRMLALYADLDPRVRIIGYVMKVFAKLCDMGDASRGSLSSYAYVILALHFLQQRRPPVIPVLQEIDHVDSDGREKKTIVDGWNAWYFNGPKEELKKFWPEWGKNKETVGELWIGLLRYYTEEFPIKDRVVTIKQSAPLMRLEKMWTGPCIAIEDPFDLAHNLGGGLSRKMNSFILKAFIKGRALFGTPTSGVILLGFKYFFDPKRLTDGKPPADRGCHVCGKIGHYVRDCPVDKANKEKLVAQRREPQGRKPSDATRNNANNPSKDDNGKPKAEEERRELSEGSMGGSEGAAGAREGVGAGCRGASGESDSSSGGGRSQRNSRTSQSSDDGVRKNGRATTPANSNQTPMRVTPPDLHNAQYSQQYPQLSQPPRHLQQRHHQQQAAKQQQQQLNRSLNRQVTPVSKNPVGIHAPNVHHASPPRHHLQSLSLLKTPPTGPLGAPQLRTPPCHVSAVSSVTMTPEWPPSSIQQQQPQPQPPQQRQSMDTGGLGSVGLTSAESLEPSTPKFGQSLDMKELFAMAGGSPVSLGSLPGSVEATPSPKPPPGGVGLESSSRRGGGGSLQLGDCPPYAQPLTHDQRQVKENKVDNNVGDGGEPQRPMAQHIAHIGSLSSSYAMQTRGGIFDAPLLAPPPGLSGNQLMQDIQISSNYRFKESPAGVSLPSREEASSAVPDPSYAGQGRAAFHTIRSLDEVAFESADAIGLGSSEMSFREIIAAKLNPVPRKVHAVGVPVSIGPSASSLPSSMGAFGAASSTWAEAKLAPAIGDSSATHSPHSFSSISGSGLSADPLASIWTPISSASESWTPETPSALPSTDEVEPMRYSREALMQLRSHASPRASLSTELGVPANSRGSNDDILGLGNLFLSRGAPTNPIESGSHLPPPTCHPAAEVNFSSMPFTAGLTGANSAYRGMEAAPGGRVIASSSPAAHALPHHQTNLSLTDDIKSALRIGEADASAATIRNAAVDAAAAASASSLLRQMEQQRPRFLMERNIQPASSTPRGAVRHRAANVGMVLTPPLASQPLRPTLPVEPPGRQGIRQALNPNPPSDVTPPQ